MYYLQWRSSQQQYVRPSYKPFRAQNWKEFYSTSHNLTPQSCTTTHSHLLVGQGSVKDTDCLYGSPQCLKKAARKSRSLYSGCLWQWYLIVHSSSFDKIKLPARYSTWRPLSVVLRRLAYQCCKAFMVVCCACLGLLGCRKLLMHRFCLLCSSDKIHEILARPQAWHCRGNRTNFCILCL